MIAGVSEPTSQVIAPADGLAAYNAKRTAFWNENAPRAQASAQRWGRYYHRRIAQIYSFVIPPNHRVLQLGCGEGDLLAAMKPSHGVGVDFSAPRLAEARRRHPHLHFVQADVHALPLDERFDFIILSDMLGDLYDIQRVLERLHPLCTPHTRIVLNMYSRLWEQPLSLAQKFGLKNRSLRQSWLTVPDVANLM
jgi:ubiquinone/menaquinone biosynthesis C-methylase UbiE